MMDLHIGDGLFSIYFDLSCVLAIGYVLYSLLKGIVYPIFLCFCSIFYE